MKLLIIMSFNLEGVIEIPQQHAPSLISPKVLKVVSIFMDGCHYDILDILTVVVIDTQEVIGGKIPTISAHGHTCILFPNGDL